jgi:hypothetical protein
MHLAALPVITLDRAPRLTLAGRWPAGGQPVASPCQCGPLGLAVSTHSPRAAHTNNKPTMASPAQPGPGRFDLGTPRQPVSKPAYLPFTQVRRLSKPLATTGA